MAGDVLGKYTLEARVAGVPIRVRASAFLFPAWAAGMGYLSNSFAPGAASPWSSAIFLGTLIVSLYAVAALHELGHILPATRFGARILGVRVSAVGAFVQVEGGPQPAPRQDLAIALGGPAVSALLSLLLGGLALLASGSQGIVWPSLTDGVNLATLLVVLAVTNTLLTVFNLLPVYPMDGGRALVAFLGLWMPQERAHALVTAFSLVSSLLGAALVLRLAMHPLLALPALMACGLVGYVAGRELKVHPRPALCYA